MLTKVIIVILMVCGQPDTVIVKRPNKVPTYTHSVTDPRAMEQLLKGVTDDNSVVIVYKDDINICI